MQRFNAVFNINLEMASPECSMTFTPLTKMHMTLWAPLALIMIVIIYGLLRTTVNYYQEFFKNKTFETAEEKKAAKTHFCVKEMQIFERVATAGTTVFTTCTIFYVRACLRPFKCVEDESGSFMASSPDTECSHDNEEYRDMRTMGFIGLHIYAVLYFALASALLRAAWMSRQGQQHQITKLLEYLGFLGDKYEATYFYWEAIIIARKLGLMIAFFLFKGEEAWLMGTAVVAVALILHVSTSPYEDMPTNRAEFSTLVAQLLLLGAAPVFKVINDPEDPTKAAQAATLMKVLENSSLVVICVACVYGLYTEIGVLRRINGTPYYSIAMLRWLKPPDEEDRNGIYDVIGSSDFQDNLTRIEQSPDLQQKQIRKLVDTFSADELDLLHRLDSAYSLDYKERALQGRIAESRQKIQRERRELAGLHQQHLYERQLRKLASNHNVLEALRQLQRLKRKHRHLYETMDESEFVVKNAISEVRELFRELAQCDKDNSNDTSFAQKFKSALDSLDPADIYVLEPRTTHRADHPFNLLVTSTSSNMQAASHGGEEVTDGDSGVMANPIHAEIEELHDEEQEGARVSNPKVNPHHIT
jgi:hypothetical protein